MGPANKVIGLKNLSNMVKATKGYRCHMTRSKNRLFISDLQVFRVHRVICFKNLQLFLKVDFNSACLHVWTEVFH